MSSSFDPFRRMSLALLGSLLNGTFVLNPKVLAVESRSRSKYSRFFPDHGAIAPSSSARSGFGITSSRSTSRWVPRPSQRSQAPKGELNEKLRGASSSKLSPQLRQANRWENMMSSE